MKRFLVLFLLLGCSKPLQPPATIPWMVDQWDQALHAAQASRQPLWIEFSAPWCIYCNILDATILTEPEIVDLAKKFVPVKIDVDKEINRQVVQKFKEYGVPLFVTANSSGEEFSRLADPSSEGLRGLLAATLAEGNLPEPERKFYEGLKFQMIGEKEKAGEAYAAALPYFQSKPELATILYFQAEEESKDEAAVQFLKTFPLHPLRPLVWKKLSELQTSEGAKWYCLQKAWKGIQEQPNSQYELIYLGMKPELASVLGIASQRDTYREIAAEATRQAKQLHFPFLSKPYWMRAVSWNIRGGNYWRAIRLAKKLIAAYPNEFTFYELLASAYAENGEWDKAVDAQEKVVSLAHEMARPKKQLELAGLYARQGNFRMASTVLKTLLDSSQQGEKEKELSRREKTAYDSAQIYLKEFETLQNL